MIKKISIILILFTGFVSAQKKELTLEQVTLESYKLRPKTLSQFQWIPGTKTFSFIDKVNEKSVLYKSDAQNTSRESILESGYLNNVLKDKGQNEIKNLTYSWINETTIKFWNDTRLLQYDLRSKTISVLNELPEVAENIDEANDQTAAYTKENNLFISVMGKETVVTNEQVKDIVNGQVVHRNEFGINKGTFWSPSANFLAYYRMDQTMVTDFPVVDFSKRPAQLQNIKYPMAGMNSHQVTIGIYNLQTGKTIFLKTGEPKDQYLTSVTWDPSEKFIYVGHLNRDQNSFQLKKYDAATGDAVQTLFSESDEKYYEPLHPLFFVPGHNDQFIWLSRADGWRHLYLCATDGKMKKQITSGNWEVMSFSEIDKDGNAYFTATKDSPLDENFYKVNIKSGKLIRISAESGTHNVKRSPDYDLFIDSYSDTTTPNKVVIRDGNGKVINKFYTAENPLTQYDIGNTDIFTIKSEDNFDLYCRTITPPDFNPAKKYPVLVYVYGGPHDQLINNMWLGGAGYWLNYMAEKGFVIFTIDNRGSNNRGKAFEQVTFRNLGRYEIQDQVKGIKYLSSLGYIDTSRVGVTGWSYGGFMTVALMTRAPEIYKVGAAGGAVIDWSYYEVMYTERYMDTPESNPDGYKEASLLNYADKLQGKLLLVHGTSDPTVVWQNTLLYAKKAADLDIPLDYFPYVGHEHGVVGKDALHLYRKMSQYFVDNLK